MRRLAAFERLDTAIAGSRTVPVRSGLSGVKTLEFSKTTSTERRAAGGDRPRSGGCIKMRPSLRIVTTGF